MLNAVKHLYRVVKWTRCHTAATFWKAQFNRLLVAISSFKYSVLLLNLLTAGVSKAQTYAIKTLEGKDARITVQDYSNKAPVHLTISCINDKLDLPIYYWNPKAVKVLNKKFLQVQYHKRAGSDMSMANTLVLCISHGKLQQVMHFESRLSEIQYVSGQDYKHWVRQTSDVELAVNAKDIAHIAVYDSLVYEQGAGRNGFTIKKYAVRFDATRCIFYNYQKRAAFILNSYDYKIDKFETRHFFGDAPAFRLGGTEYVFIDRNWYAKDRTEKEYSLVD